MLTTEIQQDTHTGPVTLNPRWLRMASAVKYSGLSRSRLYELLGQRRIKSICLKSRNDALRDPKSHEIAHHSQKPWNFALLH
jgi:hypothetical protein